MKEKWFTACRCIEDVKKTYHKLIKEWHPDICTKPEATKVMAEINNEYEAAFEQWKNTHRTVDADKNEKFYEKATDETAGEFREILENLIHYPDILIEVIGSWLWVSGDTKPIKEELKKLGFKFSAQKSSWYFHNEPYKKRHNKTFSMEDLRGLWGSQVVTGQRREQLALNE